MKNGQEVTGFADPKSFNIKNTSKLYAPNSVLHPAFLIEGSWWCKNGRIGRCAAPQQFAVDTTAMTEALNKLHSSTKYNGGIYLYFLIHNLTDKSLINRYCGLTERIGF